METFEATTTDMEFTVSDNGTAAFVFTVPPILYISIAIQICLIVVIFLGNLWVMVLIVRFRRLRNSSNYFTASMAAADFLLSLAMIPGVKITFDPAYFDNVYACLTLWCSIIFASTMSVLSLLCVSLDRLVKIVRPLRYQSILTERRVAYIICGIWIYGTCTILIPPFAGLRNDEASCFEFVKFFNYYHLHAMYICNTLIPFTILLAIYGYMFAIVREKQRTSRQFEPTVGNVKERSAWRKELKTLTTLSVIIGLSAIAWLPSLTLIILDLHFPTVQATFSLRTTLSWFLYLNSAANPILYALRSEFFRSASRQMITEDWGSAMSWVSVTRSTRVHPTDTTDTTNT